MSDLPVDPRSDPSPPDPSAAPPDRPRITRDDLTRAVRASPGPPEGSAGTAGSADLDPDTIGEPVATRGPAADRGPGSDHEPASDAGGDGDGGDGGEAPIISVADVVKVYEAGGRAVLDGVSFEVARGEFVSVGGPSGSGKSTLLHLLAALDAPTSGSIVVNGRDLSDHRHLDRYRRSEIGLVFQLHNLLPHLSAAQNVEIAMFGSHRSSSEREGRALELLTSMRLGHLASVRPPKMSGGERQRVAIARALANDPPVLLADEPTGNLDPEATQGVLQLLHLTRDELGTTLLVVSHDPFVIDDADRSLTVVDGRISHRVTRSHQP